jgi:putative ABC transport system substrate-binding protein
LRPRVFVASAAAATAVFKTVPDVPMVFTSYAGDPIKAGFAESYVRPGGRVTGNVMNAVGGEEALTQKRMNLFKELVPGLKRLGFIGSGSILAVAEFKALRSVAPQFGFEIVHYPIQGIDDVDGAVASGKNADLGAIYVSGEPLLYNNMPRALAPIMAAGKPTVGTYPEWGRAGLLMSYSADLIDDFRRAGIYAAKILGGEKPGDLPIEQASKFVLVLNLNTAKSLGLATPARLLTVADEVIE